MRVLGIDPGLTRCGFAVVEGGAGRSVALVDVGVITSRKDDGVAQRLWEVQRGLEQIMDEHAPDMVVVERVFSHNNVSTVMGTAQVSGLALALAAARAIPVDMHTPSEVKRALTGNGRADKAQVQTMVQKVLKLSAPPRPADAADAVAIAITQLWRGVGALKRDSHGAARTSAQATWAQAERRARRQAERSTSRW